MKHAQLFVLLLGLAVAAFFLLRNGPETPENLPPESRTAAPPTVHEAAHAAGDAGAARRREASPPGTPESKSSAQGEAAELAAAETRAAPDKNASRPSDPSAAAQAGGAAICSVTGKVTDEGGTPVKAARVRALAQDRQRTTEEQPVQTDEKGAFTVGVLEPGPHDLEVDADGFLLLVAPGPDCVLGAARDAGTLVVHSGLSIRGVVLGADGEPLAKRRIEAMSGDGARREAAARAVSADDGTFELAGLRPEDYRVGCLGRDDAMFAMAAGITWVVARAPAENLVLRVEEHHLEVEVTDSLTKEPIPRCEVRLVRRIGPLDEDRGAAREGRLFVVRVDAGVEYRVVAKAPGYRTPAAQRITLAREERTRRIDFALLKEDPDNVVELTITGEGGEPIERARLKVARRDGAELTFLGHVERTDPRGIHRTDPLAPGRYRIHVEARRGPSERDCHFAVDVEVEMQSGIVRRNVSLTTGGLFVVHVKDAEGRYVGGVATQLKDSAGRIVPMDFCVLTKNTTSCSSVDIPAAGAAVPGDAVKPGDYSLALSLAGFAPAVVRFTVEYDQVTPVEAVLRPAR